MRQRGKKTEIKRHREAERQRDSETEHRHRETQRQRHRESQRQREMRTREDEKRERICKCFIPPLNRTHFLLQEEWSLLFHGVLPFLQVCNLSADTTSLESHKVTKQVFKCVSKRSSTHLSKLLGVSRSKTWESKLQRSSALITVGRVCYR